MCDEWWCVGRTRRADAEGAAGAKRKTRTAHSDVGNNEEWEKERDSASLWSAGIREVNLQWCKMVQVCSDFQGGKKVA